MPRLLAIGDIHGHLNTFTHLLNVIKPQQDDTLVLLGDYVDRGPDSCGVIERILKLKQETHLVCLRGNHEEMFLHAYDPNKDLNFWGSCEGDETLLSYKAHGLRSIPETHWELLRTTDLYHETEDCIFVHANVEPDLPMESQDESTLLWQHIKHPPRHFSEKLIICGHTPQPDGLPAHMGTAVCIDSGIYRTGWLTCYEPRKNRCWQCNDAGETRVDVLIPDTE
ncbi:metallophosphoesterase family protein [Prosthecobacter sp.]|uniref:metallophosphoesterase family protein n=1 Tax=Prosthecobacter sp. TaxID=1965333 RepID=UPI0037833735